MGRGLQDLDVAVLAAGVVVNLHLHGDAVSASNLRSAYATLGRARLAVGETVILLHPPLPLVVVSIGMERGCQQNDSLADG